MKTKSKYYTILIFVVKLLPIIIFILAVKTYSNAQGVKAATFIEKTKMYTKLGHSGCVVFPSYLSGMEFGKFCQKPIISNNVENASK